jgi:hypothetical protein
MFEDGSDFLIYAHRASEMSARAHSSRTAGLGPLARVRARVQNAYNLLRDPRATWSLFAAASYIDREYLHHWLIDRTVAEGLISRRRTALDDARRAQHHQPRHADDGQQRPPADDVGGVAEGGDSLLSLPSIEMSSSVLSELAARERGATPSAFEREPSGERESPSPRKAEATIAARVEQPNGHARPHDLLSPKLTTSRLAADESSDEDNERGEQVAGSLDALQAFVHDRSLLYGESVDGESSDGDHGAESARPRAPWRRDAIELGVISQSRSLNSSMRRLPVGSLEQQTPAAAADAEIAGPEVPVVIKRPSSR